MGQSSPKQLHSDISSGRFKPVYYFFGAEDYRIGEAVKFVVRQFIPNRQLTTNFKRLDGRKVKIADLVGELSVFPMLGERQAFHVSDLQSNKPSDVDRLLKLLDPPDPNRVVIFTTPSARTPKKTSAFFKKVSAVAETVEFGPLTYDQTVGLLTSRLSAVDLSIEPEAARTLAGLVAGNRGAVEAELGKLINFKEPGETITKQDIEEIAAGYQAYSIFELAEYAARGERHRVLNMIHRLLAEGSSATGLLFFLAQHFISLYLVKDGRRLEGYRRWLESRFRDQAARFELGRIEQIIIQIAEADARLRRERVDPELMLDNLALEIMAA